MDTKIFISKVYAKREIWDKNLKLYSNREVLDRCWQDIANDMGIEEYLLRKKWKYLRDQFSVESGKAKTRHSGDNTVKWPHFKSLLFLKDFVKPRDCSDKSIRNKFMKPHVEQSSENCSESEDVDTTRQQDVFDSFLDEHELVDGMQYETVEVSVDSDEDNENSQEVLPKKRRINGKSNCDESVIESEHSKEDVLVEVLKNYQSENDDLLFFRSLLPHVSKIPDNMKLRFRSQVQKIVDEFAYNQGSDTHNLISS